MDPESFEVPRRERRERESHEGSGGGDDDERRSLFLRKSSTGLKRLRKPRCSLAAFSELSLSRSSFRFEQDDDRVRVEYYVNENTVKEKLHLYFFKNQRSSLIIRIARFALKLFTCVLHFLRVVNNADPTEAACFGCKPEIDPKYKDSMNLTEEAFLEHPVINWPAIIWVDRPLKFWVPHIILAIISLSETILLLYLNYKGNIFQQLVTRRFGLELVTTVPFILTIFYSPLRNLFVPVFLNCWLAKYALENMFNDLHRAMQRSQSALSQQVTILIATILCLVFTSMCGVEHFQRAGHRRLNLFQSFYFVVVTFSTVGYGDLVPDIWPSQLFMVTMICIALIMLPTQFEQLAFTWMERKKLGGSYSSHRAQHERHVVVCSTTLHADTIMDFLNEFYAHPLLQDYFVVLLSPMELDTTMRMILQVPIWAQRVIYIQGSCLKDGDLGRARMGEAEACFILGARSYGDKTAADEHTILRSWAVKDFAPMIPQYVQILRPENKLHVRFAEHVVCEDEFKYALLANNCLFPGTSTLVTLLLHTSRGQEGETSKEEWQKLYGKCSGNEIYHIRLGDSRFFGEYEGKSFTYASFHSHRKFGVCLVGVRPAQLPEFYEDTILLNPGPRHIMRKSDLCFYLSITKEEHSAFVTENTNSPTTNNPPTNTTSDVNEEPEESDSHQHDPHQSQHHPTPKVNVDVETGSQDQIHGNNSITINDRESEEHRPGSGPGFHTTQTSTTIQIAVDRIEDERKMSIGVTGGLLNPNSPNLNLLALPTTSDQRSNSRRPSILPVPESFPSHPGIDPNQPGGMSNNEKILSSSDGGGTSDEAEDEVPWMGMGPSEKVAQVIKGFPPVAPYIGVTPTLCYLLREKKPLCCLQLAQACEHCANRTAYDYNWQNSTIILAADYASSAIYNFIVPLRAHFRPKGKLSPIILLLDQRPDMAFLDAVSHFPMIYWFQGSINCMDDLLRAGITLAESVVVVNKEHSNSAEEDTLSDCNTIVAVQTMFRFFPLIKIVTELSQSSNMRFMQFRAHDAYALHLSRMEKREKERGSHISYMFRLPFAAGSVFSASMLDTLLYQAFVKDYLITFVRLLLGIDQAPGSGFLTSMQLTKDDLWIRTYGRLYQKLCSTTCEIPIGIYRTQSSHLESDESDYYDTNDNAYGAEAGTSTSLESLRKRKGGGSTPGGGETKNPYYSHCFRAACGSDASSFTSAALTVTDETRDSHAQLIERAEMTNLVRSRMESNRLPICEQEVVGTEKRSISYVIINPSCDLKIKEGDIVYVIRPSPFSAHKTFERHNSRRKSTLNQAAGAGNTEELQKAAYGLFQEKRTPQRRRSSSGSVPFTSFMGHGHSGSGMNRVGMSKSNSLSLPDSPRQRSNSLRVVPADDILLRRSNSLRQGLGMGLSGSGMVGRKHGSQDEIGLPIVTRSPLLATTSAPPSTSHPRQTRMTINGGINFEVTPPDDHFAQPGIQTGVGTGESQSQSPTLQGTIV